MIELPQILHALLAPARPPGTIGELEKGLGLRFDDTFVEGNTMGSFSAPPPFVTSRPPLTAILVSLSVTYPWDMHHVAPPSSVADLRSQSVSSVTVRFARGRSEIEAKLRGRFGMPRDVPNHRAYERWFVSTAPEEGEACSLTHHDRLPDWALDAPDVSARETFLVALTAALRDATSVADVERAASSPPVGSGIVFKGTSSKRVSFELAPPIAALEMVRILGLEGAIGESTDVHMSSWKIKLVVGATERGSATAYPTFGRGTLEASLTTRPTGGAVPGHQAGPKGHERLAAADLVRYVVARLD